MKDIDLQAQIRELQQEVLLQKEILNKAKDDVLGKGMKLLNVMKYVVKIQRWYPAIAIDIANIIGGESN